MALRLGSIAPADFGTITCSVFLGVCLIDFESVPNWSKRLGSSAEDERGRRRGMDKGSVLRRARRDEEEDAWQDGEGRKE